MTQHHRTLIARRTTTSLAALALSLPLLLAGCGGNTSSPSATPPARIGINTAGGWSDSPFISRDGNRLYFMYSRYDFGPWIMSGGTTLPVARGPDRPGLHKSSTNPFDESDIYMATKNPDGSWSEPVNLGLNGAHGDSSGMEFNNGNSFVWLRGNGVSTNSIVMAHKNPDGSWGAPIDPGTGINDHSTGVIQDNPHISPDGNALWFTSSRANGVGGKDQWFSLRSNGVWSTPVNMGTPFSSAGDDDQMWVSPVGLDLYWNGPLGAMHCVWDGSTCAATPEVVSIAGCGYVAEISLPDDGQSMYFGCGNVATGRVSIMYSVRQPNGPWGPAIPVD